MCVIPALDAGIILKSKKIIGSRPIMTPKSFLSI